MTAWHNPALFFPTQTLPPQPQQKLRKTASFAKLLMQTPTHHPFSRAQRRPFLGMRPPLCMYVPTQHGNAVDPGATKLRRDGAKVAPEELDCQNLAIQGPPSWGHAGPSWGHVGPSRNHLGPCWGCLGPKYSPRAKILIFLTVFNGFEGHLEAIWCHLGAILSQLGVQKSAGPELGARLPSPKNGKMARKSIGKNRTKSTSRSPGSSATLFFGGRFRSMTSIVLTP